MVMDVCSKNQSVFVIYITVCIEQSDTLLAVNFVLPGRHVEKRTQNFITRKGI